jgi:hypothetical protein
MSKKNNIRKNGVLPSREYDELPLKQYGVLSPREKYVKEIGYPSNYQIILNLRDEKELDIVLKMLLMLALDVDSQEYLINHGEKIE